MMSDRRLGDALLKLDLASDSGTLEPEVERALAADRRRVKWLARAAIGLWSLAVVGVVAMFVITGLILPLTARVRDQGTGAVADPAHSPLEILATMTAANSAVAMLSFAILVAAGLATLLLVVGSRRAMLRQVNANLLHIAEQLKRLEASKPRT